MSRFPLTNTLAFVACMSIIGFIGWRAGAEVTEQRMLAEPTAVAVIDIERALNSLTELQDGNQVLMQRVQTRISELTKQQEEMDRIEQELELLPASAVQQQIDLQGRHYQLNESKDALERVYKYKGDVEKGAVLWPLYQKLLEAVDEVASKEGYELVLFDDRQLTLPSDAIRQSVINEVIQQKRIIHASDRLDITDQVIALMNNRYKEGMN